MSVGLPARTPADDLDAFAHDVLTPAAARLRSLRGLWRALKAKKRYRLRAVAEDEVVLLPTATDAPDCGSCAKKCCAHPENQVHLRLLDVHRLIRAGLAHGIDRTATAGAEPWDSARLFVRLKKKPDGACVFHDGDKCSIYDLRPLQCRRFPHRFEDDLLHIGFSSFCESRRPASVQERRQAVNDVIVHTNAKMQDLVTLAVAPDVIKAAGLPLPSPPNPGEL